MHVQQHMLMNEKEVKQCKRCKMKNGLGPNEKTNGADDDYCQNHSIYSILNLFFSFSFKIHLVWLKKQHEINFLY